MSDLLLAAEREAGAGASRHLAETGLGIRTAAYATFGSQELADNVIEALQGRNAAMMQNHGSVAYGATMDQAVERLELLERLGEMAWCAVRMGAPQAAAH